MCRPTSGQRSVCASASIIDYEIAPDKANERGSAPPLSLSPSPSFSLSITLCRACYSIEFVLVRRVQVRRLTFRLSDDRGARGGEGEGHKRVHTREYTRGPCLSLAPCDLNTALCHGIPSALHNRTVPPWNVLHAHKRRTCSIEGKATCHALCHTACPHPLYPPMTLHLALREGGWHRYSLSLSSSLRVSVLVHYWIGCLAHLLLA